MGGQDAILQAAAQAPVAYGLGGTAVAVAVSQQAPVLTDVLVAVGAGTVVGKTVVVWRERGGRTLAPRRARQIEIAWIAAMVAIMLVIRLVVWAPTGGLR